MQVEELLTNLDLLNMTQDRFFDVISAELRESLLVRELAYGVTLVNYNQRLRDMSALVVMISLTPLLSGAKMYRTAQGNSQVGQCSIQYATQWGWCSTLRPCLSPLYDWLLDLLGATQGCRR